MNVYDKFSDVNLFELLNVIRDVPGQEFFPLDSMNTLFLDKYGRRVLSATGRHNEPEAIAKIISGMFSEKWRRVYELTIQDMPGLLSYKETVKEKITDKGKTTFNSDDTTTNTVSADNETDFVNDTKSVLKHGGENGNENEKVREFERSGFTNDISDTVLSEINVLQNTVIYDMIFSDVIGVIGLSIYE